MPFLAVHQTKRTKFLALRIHLTLDIWVVVDCGDEPGELRFRRRVLTF